MSNTDKIQAELQGLEQSIQAVSNSIHNVLEDYEKHARRKMVVLWAMPVFVLAYLAWFYVQIRQVNPELVMGWVAESVHSYIPQLSESVDELLVNHTDDLLEKMDDMADEGLDQANVYLYEQLPKVFDLSGDWIKSHCMADLKDYLEDHQTDLINSTSQMSAKDRADYILEDMRREFRHAVVENFLAEMDGLGEGDAELNGVNNWLRRLARAKDLTEDEKLQKVLLSGALNLVDYNLESWEDRYWKHGSPKGDKEPEDEPTILPEPEEDE